MVSWMRYCRWLKSSVTVSRFSPSPSQTIAARWQRYQNARHRGVSQPRTGCQARQRNQGDGLAAGVRAARIDHQPRREPHFVAIPAHKCATQSYRHLTEPRVFRLAFVASVLRVAFHLLIMPTRLPVLLDRQRPERLVAGCELPVPSSPSLEGREQVPCSMGEMRKKTTLLLAT